MNARALLLLTVIMKVVSVKSECDDYLTCLSSFFGNFYNEKDKTPPLDTVIAKNSKDTPIDVSKKELDQILRDVSSFLNEELDVQPKSDLKTTVFRKFHNQTAIYVKTFDVSDYFDDSSEGENDETKTGAISKLLEKNKTVNVSPIKPPETLNNDTVPTENIKQYNEKPKIVMLDNATDVTTVSTIEALTQSTIIDIRENEIEIKDDSYQYDSNEDNSTDYLNVNYLEYYKDTTNEYVNLETTESPLSVDEIKDNVNNAISASLHNTIMNSTVQSTEGDANNIAKELTSVVYPWLATIFIKDNSSDEFKYYCDGAFLTNKAVITAAGCIRRNDVTTNPEDIVVIAGKKSLTNMMGTEIAVRIKEIKAHANFTAVKEGNDLAILILEEPVTLSDDVQVAHLHREVSTAEYIVTTGWQTTGDLTPIFLTNGGDRNCGVEASVEDVFCAVYGNDVTVCPSYGGLYVTKGEAWHLQGLRTADPEDRGLCFDRNVAFTSFDQHWEWIKDNME